MTYIARLKKDYNERVISELKKEFSYKSVMQVPKIIKIVVSKGIGAAVADKKLIEHAIDELTLITGQKAIATLSRKDVASFKLRKGMAIGVKVTLRGEKMYEFLDRLITAALPRVRDFQGLKVGGFDGRGNYTLGVSEQIIFPEIDIDKVNKISGMDITIVTSSKTDQEAKSLLKEIGLPFNDKEIFKKEPIDNISSEVEVIKESVSNEDLPSKEVSLEKIALEENSIEDSSEEAPLNEVSDEDIALEGASKEEQISSDEQVSSEKENLKTNEIKGKKL